MKEVGNNVLYHAEDRRDLANLIDPAAKNKINITEMLMALSSKPKGQITDRTNTFAGRYKTIVDPIPELPSNFNKSFSDIASERSTELLSTGKEIIVSWSGGIDATYALVSLLKNCSDTSQITVSMNYFSIVENDYFYLNYIKNKLKVIAPTDYYPRIIPTENQIFVTGDQIPQIFGFSFVSFSDSKHESWISWVLSKFDSKEKANWFLSNIKPWLDKSPVEIKTVFDFMWWLCFSVRWNNNRFKPLRWNSSYDKNIFENNIKPFFRTTDFEIWSMLNHDKKIKNDAPSFKYIMKEEIFEFDKNENYLNQKTSERSNVKLVEHFKLRNFRDLIQEDKVPVLIDENFTYFFKSEIKQTPENFAKLLNPTDTNEWFSSKYTLLDNNCWLK